MKALPAGPQPPVHERILQAADRLFYREGIHAVGVDALASAAGVSKRTLYKHFPSKDDLIVAYLLRRASRLAPAAGQPLELILGVFDGLMRAFGSSSFRGCPYANAAAELGGNPAHPAVETVRQIKLARMEWFSSQFTQLGVADPDALAYQMMLLVEGAITNSMVRGGDPQAAVAAKAAAKILLKAAGIRSLK